MFLFRLGRKTRDERRAERDFRNFRSERFEKFEILFFASPPPHQSENAVLAMLQRNIEIFQNFRIIANLGDQSPVDLFRITV